MESPLAERRRGRYPARLVSREDECYEKRAPCRMCPASPSARPSPPEQRAFLREHGFLLFAGVATPDEVAMLGEEMERIEAAGSPRAGSGSSASRSSSARTRPAARFSSASRSRRCSRSVCMRSCAIPRFAPILDLVGDGARVGDRGEGRRRLQPLPERARQRVSRGSAGTPTACATSSTAACRRRC